MAELRRGRIHRRWVLIAPDRGERPFATAAPPEGAAAARPGNCPFCPGREAQTPPEIDRVTGPDGTWQVRVIPNRYPALSPCDEDSPGTGSCARQEPPRGAARRRACGVHEVVIETPDHDRPLSALGVEHLERVLGTFSARMRALMENAAHRHVIVFKNRGAEAGASLAHPHSQIVATPMVPEDVADVLATAEAYYHQEGRCLFCDVIDEELADERRVVEDADGFTVLSPYAARLPFEVAIYPRRHVHDFTAETADVRRALACVLKRTLGRLSDVLGEAPYNLILQSAPNVVEPAARQRVASAYHWRIEIIPRLARLAGLEWATGMTINTVSPEMAAERLRNATPAR